MKLPIYGQIRLGDDRFRFKRWIFCLACTLSLELGIDHSDCDKELCHCTESQCNGIVIWP